MSTLLVPTGDFKRRSFSRSRPLKTERVYYMYYIYTKRGPIHFVNEKCGENSH